MHPTFHAGTTIEYFNLMSDSFCGTTISNPEASLHWALTGKTIFTPLRKKPNKKRKEVFKYMLWSGGLGGISTKSAYGLLDPNGSGKFVAGTVCYAPYTYPPKNNVYNSVNGTSQWEMPEAMKVGNATTSASNANPGAGSYAIDI